MDLKLASQAERVTRFQAAAERMEGLEQAIVQVRAEKNREMNALATKVVKVGLPTVIVSWIGGGISSYYMLSRRYVFTPRPERID